MPSVAGLGVIAANRRRAPAGWNPTALATILRWYDPTDEATITDTAGAVSAIADKSANAGALTTAGGVTTGETTLNGLNVIDFDGTGQLTEDLAYGGSTLTVVAAIAWSTTADQRGITLVNGATTDDWNSDDNILAVNCDGGQGKIGAYRHGYGGGPLGGTSAAGWLIVSTRWTGTTGSTIRINGTTVATGDLGAGVLAADELIVGAGWLSSAYGGRMVGSLGGLVLCSSALSDGDVGLTETFLNDRLAIA